MGRSRRPRRAERATEGPIVGPRRRIDALKAMIAWDRRAEDDAVATNGGARGDQSSEPEQHPIYVKAIGATREIHRRRHAADHPTAGGSGRPTFWIPTAHSRKNNGLSFRSGSVSQT